MTKDEIMLETLDRLTKKAITSKGYNKKIKIKKKKEIVTNKKRIYRNNKHINIFKEFWGDVIICQKCGGTKGGLQIHHINKNCNDNHPFNLIKICLVCHCEEHKGESIYNLMKKRLDFILKT